MKKRFKNAQNDFLRKAKYACVLSPFPQRFSGYREINLLKHNGQNWVSIRKLST